MIGKLDKIIAAIEGIEASTGVMYLALLLMLLNSLLMIFKDGYMGGIAYYSASIVIVNLLIGSIICRKLEKKG